MGLNDRERAILYKTCVDCLLQFDPRTNREKAEVILSKVIGERCRKWDPKELEKLSSDNSMSNYIEPCPKCKATKGWIWVWGKNDGHSTGKSKCKGCGATF